MHAPARMIERDGVWNAFFLTILASLAAPNVISYAIYLAEWRLFHEEIRILFYYHSLVDPELFTNDYIAGYVDSIARVYGYDFINNLWAKAFSDLQSLHLYAMPTVLPAVFFAGLMITAHRIGGLVHAGCATVLAILLGNVLYRVGSPVPHAFAFPLLIWTACALQYRSVAGLCAVTLLSALLYPPITPVPGLSLFFFLVLTSGDLRGGAAQMTLRVRLLVVGAVGVLAILIAIPTLPDDSTEFGATLAPGTRIDEFPENGPGGRHFQGALEPFSFSFLSFFRQFALFAHGDPIQNSGGLPLAVKLAGIALVGLFLAFMLLKTDQPQERLLKPFVGAALLVSVVLPLVLPTYAYRFIFYSMHLVFLLVFPLIMLKFLQWGVERPRMRLMLAALVMAGFSFGTQSAAPGPMARAALAVTEGQRAAIEFARTQPKGTVFAGWPGFTIDMIPYFAQRPALLLYKTHYPSHDLYAAEMRRRMIALIDAYFATESAPLERLHEVWGVDYLVVERVWLDPARANELQLPPTFEPFDARVEMLWRRNVATGFFLANLPPQAVVLNRESIFVVDLRLL